MRRMDQAVAVLAVTVAALSTAACTGRAGSKAGGDPPPVTLRIGTDDEPGRPAADAIDEFARQVRARSHGRIRIEPVWKAAGTDPAPGWDQAVARLVTGGRLDLGMIPARAFDTEQVTSLRALQAPFLVSSDALATKVAAAPLAGEMLAGLDRAGVTGLALVPERAREFFSFGRPVAAGADLRGVTVRAPRAETTFALYRALGANPDDLVGGSGNRFPDGVAAGLVGAAESSYDRGPDLPKASTATGNLDPYFKMNAVVVNARRFAALDPAQRDLLRTAATATRDWSARTMPATADEAQRFCRNGGTVTLATPADRAGFERAARPVYAALEQDPQTAALIAGIRALAAGVPPSPPVLACRPRVAATPAGRSFPAGFPTGVYRKQASEQAMLADGVSGRDAKDHAGLWTMTFDRGAFTIQQYGFPRSPAGVYCVAAGQVTAIQGGTRCDGGDGLVLFTASWQLDGDQLRFTAATPGPRVAPSPLTAALFGGAPWTRIS